VNGHFFILYRKYTIKEFSLPNFLHKKSQAADLTFTKSLEMKFRGMKFF